MDDPLDFFRPCKVRGNTVGEKVESFVQTLSKVIQDGKDDKYQYRIDYVHVHQLSLDILDKMVYPQNIMKLNIIYNNCLDIINDEYNVLINNPGRYDACCRIVVEIEDILLCKEI